MLKMMATILTALSLLTQPAVVSAENQGARQYPRTKCDRTLIRKIYNEERTDLIDEVRKYYIEQKTAGVTDAQFCAWLRLKYEGKETEARYECITGRCNAPEPETPEVEQSFPRPFRREMRRIAQREPPPEPPEEERPPRESGSGSFMSNPFMGGLLGGALGGFLGAMLAGRMNQQQSYFPQPQWGPGMNNMMMPGMQPPGMLPFPGGQMGGAPGMLPFPGQQFGATNPWAMPYQGGQQLPYFAGGGMPYGGGYGGYSGYNGGVYRGAAPGVLPLAPQSSYSVMGSIPQNHWSLINAGR